MHKIVPGARLDVIKYEYSRPFSTYPLDVTNTEIISIAKILDAKCFFNMTLTILQIGASSVDSNESKDLLFTRFSTRND